MEIHREHETNSPKFGRGRSKDRQLDTDGISVTIKMKTDLNLANALVILGSLYFIYSKGFSVWILLLILFAVGTWAYQYTDKKILKKKGEEIDAKINNIKTLTAESGARTLNLIESTKHIMVQRMHMENQMRK